jgi:medium-chain acyl-[acyl-carrier-protein] hydrolase
MPEVLLTNPELLDLLCPVLRADFELCETYRYSNHVPLNCALTAFGALEDRKVNHLELSTWQLFTTHPLTLRLLEGDHYFFETHWDKIARSVAEDLELDGYGRG